jgi:thiol-disulfide isomerase/thioredoxin
MQWMGLGLLLVSTVMAQGPRGILGKPAPELRVAEWLDGAPPLRLADLHGKVVFLYCFQAWCPACSSHGFPTLQRVAKAYRDVEDVALVAVQTVFEGFDHNTAAAGRRLARRFFEGPVGHDPGAEGRLPKTMGDFDTGGTPWTIVIDRNGIVRFNDFRIETDAAKKLIEELRREEVVPRNVVGQPFGDWTRLRWMNRGDSTIVCAHNARNSRE